MVLSTALTYSNVHLAKTQIEGTLFVIEHCPLEQNTGSEYHVYMFVDNSLAPLAEYRSQLGAEALLKNNLLKHNPENWQPVYKHDPVLGHLL